VTLDEIDRRLDAGNERGWVYLIGADEDERVKIRWARDPERRLAALQIGHPDQLKLLAVIPGTKRLERDIHRKLIYARLGGEWFDRKAALRLLRPVIAEHGLKLIARAAESRNSLSWPEGLPRTERKVSSHFGQPLTPRSTMSGSRWRRLAATAARP
jgi:hypothetical protein